MAAACGTAAQTWATMQDLTRSGQAEDVLDVIANGAISAPMFALKGPLMEKGTYAPAFPLKHAQKVSNPSEKWELFHPISPVASWLCIFSVES